MAAKVYRKRIPKYAQHAFEGKDRVAEAYADQASADDWLAGIEKRIKAARIGSERASRGAKTAVPFDLAAAGWYDQLEVRPSVLAWYKTYTNGRLKKAFGDTLTSKIGLAALTAHRKARKDQGASARTIQAELDIAQRVLRWARGAGYAIDETAFDVVKPEVRTKRRRRYDPDEIERLLAAARKGPAPSEGRGPKKPDVIAAIAARDVLAVELLTRTGLRAGELRALCAEWFILHERRLVVPHNDEYSPKGGEERSIPLEKGLLELVTAHLAGQQKGRVFAPRRTGRPAKKGEDRQPHFRGTGMDVDLMMERLSERAGLDLNAHDLRHYCISRWVDMMGPGEYSLADVQAWAGHASIRTTELYLHQAGGRWRSHAEGLDRAATALGSKLGTAQSRSHHLKAVDRL